MPTETLAIEVDADVAGAAGGLEVVNSQLKELTVTSGVASEGVDELGDEMSETAAETGTLATAFNALLPGMLTISSIGPGVIATVVGLVAALGGLAIVFGAIGAAGVAAGFSELKGQLGETRDEIMAIVGPWGEEFVPILEDTLDSLPRLVEMLIAAIGPTDQFTAALRDFGTTGAKSVVTAIDVLATLGRVAIPPLRALLFTVEGLLPFIFATSEAVQLMMENFHALPQPIRSVSAALLAVKIALLGLSAPVTAIIGGLALLGQAWQQDFLGVRSGVLSAINDIVAGLEDIRDMLLGIIDKAETAAEALGKLNPFGEGSGFRGINEAGRRAAIERARQSGGGISPREKQSLVQDVGVAPSRIEVTVENINASSRREGREAGLGMTRLIKRELRQQTNIPDTSRGG